LPWLSRAGSSANWARGATLFPYDTAESVWNEHRESTRGRDLDITGMSYAMLETAGPQQWPLKQGESTGRARLYEDGVFPTPDGRARFVDTVYKPVAEAREPRYPFSLNTGRLRDQWHGMSRTGTAGRLFGHVAEPVVQMHAQDMARRHIGEGDLVHVTSKRGSILLPARASAELGLSQAFVAMHWGEEYLSGCSSTGERLAGINALTTPAFCPTSKQPELKHTPVKILKAELPWSLLAMAWLPTDAALTAQRALQPLMAMFPFATCVPFAGNTQGQERSGLLFRAAAHEAPDDALLEKIEALLGLQAADTLRYADRRRGQRRAARLLRRADGSVGLEAFLLGGDTSAEAWIATLLREELPAQSLRPPAAVAGRNERRPAVAARAARTVCTCFNVTQTWRSRQELAAAAAARTAGAAGHSCRGR
jgi:assimilatory nitrate reductase catalytic subunit